MKSLFTLCLLILINLPQASAIPGEKLTFFDIISYQPTVDFNLELDLDKFIDEKNDGEYQPAWLTFTDKNGIEHRWKMKVRARGRYRRRICGMPPMKLNLDKDDLEDFGLCKDDEYKLVTQCVEDEKGKDYVLREYFAYKLFEKVSDQYFRTQLLRITYQDTESKRKIKTVGFILEDEKTLERRHDADLIEDVYNTPLDSLQRTSVYQCCLFQFLIANTDYSYETCRNVKFLRLSDKEVGLLVVPYDFDFSGLVNASYAVPDSNYKLSSLRERCYLGPPIGETSGQQVLANYLDRQEELLQFTKSFDQLPRRDRKDIYKFLKKGFRALENGQLNSPDHSARF